MVPTPIAIVGAGPYGLSLAAHLRSRGVGFRIFGTPMYSWQSQMPRGMLLKSEGFASNIADPELKFSLASFCQQRGMPYQDIDLPVPVETFVEYGLEFQRQFVPNIERRQVVQVERDGRGFILQLDDGECLVALQVVVAVGVGHFAHVPDELRTLCGPHLSHSSQHTDLDGFRDSNVIVIGGGASAADLAVLLRRAGAFARLVARRKKIDFHTPPRPRPRRMMERLRQPSSALGVGWPSRMAQDAPLIFHMMPRDFRLLVVKRHLGPAPGWFTRDQLVGHVPMLPGRQIVAAGTLGDQVRLRVADANGVEE